MKRPSSPKKGRELNSHKPRPPKQKSSTSRRVVRKQKPTQKKVTKATVASTELYFGSQKPRFVRELVNRNEYNDGYDRSARTLHTEALVKYIDADKEYYKRTGLNIDINKNNARRGIRRQAELYVLRRWFNQGNPTDRPGHSLHNYGLAVDLIRTNENTLVEIMGKNGWTREKPHEPWHFEFTGSKAHSRAKAKIKDLMKSNSPTTKWWNTMDSMIKKEKELEERQKIYEKELADYTAGLDEYNEWDGLYSEDVNAFNSWYKELENDLAAHNQQVAAYDKLVKEGEVWLSQIEAMEEGSVKEQELANYDVWKAEMDRDFDALMSNADTIDSDFAWAEGRVLELENEYLELEKRLTQLTALENTLNSEYNALDALENEIESLTNKSESLLSELEVIVQNI